MVARNREKKRFPFSPVFREPDRQDSIPSTSAATSASWTINVRSHRKKRPYFLSRCLGVIFPSSCFRLCSDYLHRLPSTEIPSFRNFVRNHATDLLRWKILYATQHAYHSYYAFSPTGMERKRDEEFSTLFLPSLTNENFPFPVKLFRIHRVVVRIHRCMLARFFVAPFNELCNIISWDWCSLPMKILLYFNQSKSDRVFEMFF